MANVPFTRERAAEHVNAMIAWFLGVSGDTAGRVTDFNVGSNIRTLLEVVAMRLEVFDQKVYAGMRRLIPTVLYEWFGEGDGITSTVGFPLLPARAATGIARFTTALGATNVTIPANTRLVGPQVQAPVTYRTLAPVTVAFGGGTVDAPIVADRAGARSSAPANTCTLLDPVTGVTSATNPAALIGADQETEEARRLRFVDYIRNLARAQFGGIEVGARTATVLGSAGEVVEQVVSARAVTVADRLGRLSVYIDNGGGTASAALVARCQAIVDGYLDAFGVRVHGYVAAGIVATVRPVTPQPVAVTVQVRVQPPYLFPDVQAAVAAAVSDYLVSLGVFADLIQSELRAVVAMTPGVADHRMTSPDAAKVSALTGGRILPGTITVTEDGTL